MIKTLTIALMLVGSLAHAQWVPVMVNTNDWMAKPTNGFTNYWDNPMHSMSPAFMELTPRW